MARRILPILALALAASPFVLPAQSPGPISARVQDENAIREVLNGYLRSHATGEGSHVGAVFHPVLQMLWVVNDTLARRTAAEYVAGFRGTPPADEARRRRWIASVDVFGTAAAARVVLDYPTVTFVDFFTLLKIGGEWKIVSKTFSSEPKPSTAQ
ncbi:MAG TPA: nuclear transport factor 2 family protein [Gemmatimonadales bacterium]|nr:nuclear transport factor 2 family protein [Gemmatimonadales bacterium]